MSGRLLNQERRYSLSTKRGWRRYAESPARERPEVLPRAQLAQLSTQARDEYEECRAVWNANIGPIHTPQLLDVHQDLWNILASNREDGDKPRFPAVIDAFPGLGKSTIAQAFGRDYHRRQIELYGQQTVEGHEHIPVVRIQLTDETTRRDFNSMLCRFFNLPGYDSGNANHLGHKAADAIMSCGSTLILVDDVHFLDMRRRSGRAVANHFKALTNDFPVTFLYVGVGLERRGLLDEGLAPGQEELAQNSRRWTPLTVAPFTIDDEPGRATWRKLLLTIEKAVVLADKYPGMVADDLSDVLFARSTGHFASLMTLIKRGCAKSITEGEERLTAEILSKVKNDAAAERARTELQAAIEGGRLSSRPRSSRAPQSGKRRPTASVTT
ncbi:ATP-binding protein [Streptosporangium sp. NBC_01469]|uniref:ATP-binding protein n=1 Tax=Streptosporangium sp. NBC_01469 TaxID=2903898 RepID=UPI002E29B930|nr:ATP-binding protein [Streptosporangium sp. NBC_01469]